MNKSKNNHLKSINHERLDEAIIRRYIIPNPNINQIDEILKKYVMNYKEKYERYSVDCVLKFLTTTNRVRYIRTNTRVNLDYFFNFSENSIFSKIKEDLCYFSQSCDIRITFSSSFRDMTYDYYLKQRMPMYEIKKKSDIS